MYYTCTVILIFALGVLMLMMTTESFSKMMSDLTAVIYNMADHSPVMRVDITCVDTGNKACTTSVYAYKQLSRPSGAIDSCKPKKCPTTDNPVCVRMKYPDGPTIYVLAINKCEAQYAKCHSYINSVEVPMKYCNQTKIQSLAYTRHKRTKRDAAEDEEKLPKDKKLYNLIFDGKHRNEHMIGKAPPQKMIEDVSDTVDLEQYKSDCPTVCPASNMMVCGRLPNGIYRTFLSICHMRMYSCRRVKAAKGLHLVSRYPCILQAPYLLNTKGRLKQRGNDVVLLYIFCKFKNGDDPRCPAQPSEKYDETKIQALALMKPGPKNKLNKKRVWNPKTGTFKEISCYYKGKQLICPSDEIEGNVDEEIKQESTDDTKDKLPGNDGVVENGGDYGNLPPDESDYNYPSEQPDEAPQDASEATPENEIEEGYPDENYPENEEYPHEYPPENPPDYKIPEGGNENQDHDKPTDLPPKPENQLHIHIHNYCFFGFLCLT